MNWIRKSEKEIAYDNWLKKYLTGVSE